MPIDPKVALGAELPSKEFSWTASDVQLYHLGIGAGHRWTEPAELRYMVLSKALLVWDHHADLVVDIAPGLFDASTYSTGKTKE